MSSMPPSPSRLRAERNDPVLRYTFLVANGPYDFDYLVHIEAEDDDRAIAKAKRVLIDERAFGGSLTRGGSGFSIWEKNTSRIRD